MNEDLEQQIHFDFPHLMERSPRCHFEHDDGWYSIIYSLCSMFYAKVALCDRSIEFYDQKIAEGKDHHADREVIVRDREQSIECLPIIVQIKEKFGTLRVYVEMVIEG